MAQADCCYSVQNVMTSIKDCASLNCANIHFSVYRRMLFTCRDCSCSPEWFCKTWSPHWPGAPPGRPWTLTRWCCTPHQPFKNTFTLIIPIIPIRSSFTSDTGSFFKCQTDSTKSRFSVAYSFSRKERKWSLPAGSLSNSQPAIKLMILIIQTASWELFASTLNHLQLVARKRSTQSLDILKSYYEMEKWLRLERAQSGANSWIKFG